MQLNIIVLTLLVSLQSFSLGQQQQQKKETVLRDIVFMRTEGLIMTQMMEKHSKNKNMLAICKRAKSYYTSTQPMLLEITKGKALDLDKRQFEQIWKEAEKSFQKYTIKNEDEWNRMYEGHIHACIRAYSLLVQEQQWPDIAYFSFHALPGLINLEEAFKQLDVN
ncbi:hypothetical protein LZQ00_05980 [Sphingobacterium sp. SRCM116780]|uniref:hypothetical protein n=1 Tax=Sphingobacterium sp. SRCM116780 TaxID=2907623 RepID=UPI001F3AEB9B|nr:hypothetical protein [Sphingobacterium sp. SRCM116780]UIR57364.1 hypothetical protein LZQ00_05980 [Sphingobacterium sp. SRCM116780]